MSDTVVSAPSVHRDYSFALAVMAILAVFFVPIPPFAIDVGLAISIALSIVVLLVALWIEKPTDFSAFPTILLIATTLRLALNIATTRLILADGNHGDTAAGYVIAGFSRLLMQGDFVIGIVVFVIVVTVNFVVITKGATRIAEVAARFTLDSIPGKQMAIDADLSAGLINEQQAHRRREELEEETAFFGAMDGASKFVRGDAIAGIIILVVNSIGGIVLGMMRHKQSFAEAADVFMRLSIGDGLVTQIPALIVALAAGLVVSKGGARGRAERAVLDQLGEYPRALWVAASLLFIIALLPGMPVVPFLAIAGICAYFARNGMLTSRRVAAENASAGLAAPSSVAEATGPSRQPVVEVTMGKLLASRMLGPKGDLARRIGRMRRKMTDEYGFIIPEVRLREDYELPERQYRICIHAAVAARHNTPLGDVLVIGPADRQPDVAGFDDTEPAFGLPARRYSEGFSNEIRRQGFEPVTVESILLTHLVETLRDNLGQIFSYRDLRGLLDNLEPEYRRLFDELSPSLVSTSGLLGLVKSLLTERVSIRNFPLVLEGVAESAGSARRLESLVDAVRLRLAPQICADASDQGVLRVLKVGPRWEGVFSDCMRRDAKGELIEFALEPRHIEGFGMDAATAIRARLNEGASFVIATSPESRPFVRMLVARINPAVPVLSHLEVARCREIAAIGAIS